MRNKDWIKLCIFIILIGYFIPRVGLFYLMCGLFDFQRSKRIDAQNLIRYFLGNGLLTWVLSPFNLVMDLLTKSNKGIYQLEDLPEECQAEIQSVIQIAKNKPEIMEVLQERMVEKRRGMLFFKWYGKNINNSIQIPEFHNKYKYIRTVGVSVFNKNQATSIHYGPLRVTLRVLYNLTATQNTPNNNIYIDVANQRHYWHANPLFIFDDTLVHQSVNNSEELRYCMFIDILRPSNNLNAINNILKVVRFFIMSFNRIFYKNWDMIK